MLADKPYMGWSSWSLESTNFPGYGGENWLTEANVLKQADVVAAKLKPHGYNYVNVDAGWNVDNGKNVFDGYGRPIADAKKFPDGMKYVGDQLHKKGLKFGLYLAVGLYIDAYNDGKTPVYGAPGCTTKDLVYPDLRKTSGWDNVSYQMNWSSPCSQKYIDSVANELASWGVDFLKVDGVGPGSVQGDAAHDNIPDVQAWHKALQATGRPIQLTLSWSLSHPKVGHLEAERQRLAGRHGRRVLLRHPRHLEQLRQGALERRRAVDPRRRSRPLEQPRLPRRRRRRHGRPDRHRTAELRDASGRSSPHRCTPVTTSPSSTRTACRCSPTTT